MRSEVANAFLLAQTANKNDLDGLLLSLDHIVVLKIRAGKISHSKPLKAFSRAWKFALISSLSTFSNEDVSIMDEDHIGEKKYWAVKIDNVLSGIEFSRREFDIEDTIHQWYGAGAESSLRSFWFTLNLPTSPDIIPSV